MILLMSFVSCNKDKLEVTCSGTCQSPDFLVKGETGNDVSFTNFTTQFTYDNFGNVSKMTFSGGITYNDSGNTYQVTGESTISPCEFTWTVRNAAGEQATCGN
jgi:hypothetical protein